MRQRDFRILALFGHGAMSDLSPEYIKADIGHPFRLLRLGGAVSHSQPAAIAGQRGCGG
jgi:hypothetical protein